MTDNSSNVTSNDMSLPLTGVRVIDMADGKGEMCGRLLADFGAEVILVEPPKGLASRQLPPFYRSESLYFATHNANKRSVVLDLDTDQGKADFLALSDRADILIEADKPGRMAERDLSAATLRERNPQLIVVSITDFGQTGPYSQYRGSNSVLMAMGGVLARSGIEGERPLLPPAEMALEATAVQAAWATMVAYWQRLQTGKGNTLDFSMFEATAQILDPGLGVTGSAAAGRSASEMAPYGRPPIGKLYPIFACADGHVRICVLNPRQWQGMCAWLGDDHPFTDPAYGNIAKRFSEIVAINALIAELFKDKNAVDLVMEGQSRGVPIAAVSTPAQVLEDEQFNARGAFTALTLADGAEGKVPAGYLELDGQRMGIRQTAPELGANQSILDGLSTVGDCVDQASEATSSRRPFEGIRILDLGVIVAGAELGRLFADQGAEVIKVENSAFPDGLRQSSGGAPISQSFSQGSRNKLSMGLNLRTEKGIALFHQLAKESDVILSNFKPGTLESLGIGYDQLKTLNPGIIVLESSALGNTGPLAKSMGYGPLVRASSGLTGLWCYPEIEGSYSDSITIFPDHFAARVAAVGIVAALARREQTGVGGKVALSQAETILNTLATSLLRESVEPNSFRPLGNQYEFDAPANVFPCAGDDLWCVVEVKSNSDWLSLCTAIDRPDLLEVADYKTAEGRLQNRETLEAIVRDWTEQRSPYEVLETLQAAGLAAGNMQRLSEFDNNPHFLARKFFRHFEQPGFPGILQTENGPVSFSELPEPEIRPAPFQGQHTLELAKRLLGLSPEEIQALTEEGALEPMADNEFVKA
ncbi:MAG: CoA transferase [Cellvibrionaceae bacterium]|nr:CoA transferase [Cellvibrionaceae bacterium]|tara:strand:+ start:8271 stop:10721 length:2451 start_codon:yes stop_codon:yes gene_type:complete